MSKLKLLSSVAVAALIAMPAFAQTSTTTTSPSNSRPATTAPMGSSGASSHSMPSDIHQWKVSDLVGKNVYNSSNEKVGDINEVVVPKSGGGKAMAVIGVGGFLGIGEKEAAVPLDELKVQDDKIVGAGLSKDSLKQHADYKGQKDNYTKLDRNQTVSQAAGTTGSTGATTRPSTSGSSTTGSSTTGSSSNGASGTAGSTTTTPSGSSSSTGSSGTSGSSSSGSMNSGGSSTGSSSMGSGSSSGSSTGSGASSTSPNPAATTNPPDNSTATKKQ